MNIHITYEEKSNGEIRQVTTQVNYTHDFAHWTVDQQIKSVLETLEMMIHPQDKKLVSFSYPIEAMSTIRLS